MKQVTTEIFIEVEETLVVRPIEPTTKSDGNSPGAQTICRYCGHSIGDPKDLDSGDVRLESVVDRAKHVK